MNGADVGALCGELCHHVNGSPLEGRQAVSLCDSVLFVLRVPRKLGVLSCRLRFAPDGGGKRKQLPLAWKAREGSTDVYEAACPPAFLRGLMGLSFYRVEAKTVYGTVYGHRRPGCAMSLVVFSDRENDEAPRQLLVSDIPDTAPTWLYGSVIYHVFVDRFRRHGVLPVRADAILNEDWENGIPQYPDYPGGPLANNMFFGGNLAGVEEKLDYIASLGVGCIYLSPIFEAYSNHKYDTGDYMTVDAMFGGEEAFKSLIAAAEQRGIRIVLDGVFNHTGADSRYFNRYGRYDSLGAYQSKESPYYNWYRFQDYPDKYTCWWDIPILPRIHPEEPDCRAFFVGKEGVIAHYAQMGIGGFRLDVADELSDDLVAAIKSRLREHCPDAVLYGEVWEDASNKIAYGNRRRYYYGHELDGVMNYPLRTGLISWLRHRDADPLWYALTEVLANCPKQIADATMNLLGTHDTERIMTALAGKERGSRTNQELAHAKMSAEEYALGVRRLMMAYTALATLPGVPSVFYGDEVGMQGYGDPFNRLPFPWHRMNETLLAHYRRLGALRRAQAVYEQGEFALLRLDADVLAFLRFDQDNACLTFVNQGVKDVKLSFGRPVCVLLGAKTDRAACHIVVPAGDAAVIALSADQALSLHGQAGMTLSRGLSDYMSLCQKENATKRGCQM